MIGVEDGARRDRLVDLVREAGRRARDLRRNGVRARAKGRCGDLVTEADEAVEGLLVERLRELRPEAAIRTEEAGELSPARGDGTGDVWLVDPVDGTVNYARGRPWYGVSVALRDAGGRTRLAALHWPEAGGTLSLDPRGVEDHEGAGEPSVSSRGRLDGATVAVAVAPFNPPAVRTDSVALKGRLLESGCGLRSVGCGSYELAMVAKGRLDGFVFLGEDPYSTAAALPVIEAAGGRVSDVRGRPTSGDRPGIVATNGRIHDQLLDAVEAARGRASSGPRGRGDR